MSKDVQTLKKSFKKLDTLSLYELVTIACIVGVFVNMLFSIDIIRNTYLAQYFLYTLFLGIVVSVLFVAILLLSIHIFSNTSKSELNIALQKKDRYFYYLLLCVSVLFYLVAVSFIKSGYFGLDSSNISFVNGIESLVLFLYMFFALAICSPIFIYEYELNKKMKSYDSSDLSKLE